MGANHSHNELLDSSDDEEQNYQDAAEEGQGGGDSSSERGIKTPSSLDEVEAKLKALKLKYSSATPNAVKLYLHVGGNTPQAKWVTADKLTSYTFVRVRQVGEEQDEEEEEEDDDEDEDEDGESWWFLKVGSKIRSKVGLEMQLKTFASQRRVDFVSRAVWAMKFFTDQDYDAFVTRFQDCMFENTHGIEATEQNKLKVYGKDFIGWANPDAADDSMWEDAEDAFAKSPASATPVRPTQDLREEFEEAANGGIQSLALGALDNSFLVGDTGIQVVKNFAHGIHGKGAFVHFGQGYQRDRVSSSTTLEYCTPKKTLLMKAETNMLLMSPVGGGKLHSTGLHQLDIETGKVVTEWKFGKDGTDITMRDITNDSKGAQLDPTGSTFLGLDDNRLCRWDMRDRNGIVQNIADASTPVLNWAQGHQFSRGTNFQCFATTGDGSIVVGSLDGKIRLYSINSMRQAKTAFPGLGSPITHVDVTYDGKWIVGTTDTYLIVISGTNNKFRKAQFSWVTENGRQERHIVATVGKFSVIWNFQQVKDGSHECYQNQQGLKSCYCYKIVLRDDSIVDSRFMHDNFAVTDSPEAPLVIATPMKVSSFSISSKQ
ncbi:Protein cypro4 [Stylosanthes scabra]|uniref:Protein cypro4 n=1 Tax=Stylosanthes scabra TaxID=79078 RepID=A0ABU6XCH4_9FABA|nr:Protein cypro4 [Stylosanthes scabra]